MFKKKPKATEITETYDQFTERKKKENDQSVKASAVRLALDQNIATDVDILIKNAKKIYEFLSK